MDARVHALLTQAAEWRRLGAVDVCGGAGVEATKLAGGVVGAPVGGGAGTVDEEGSRNAQSCALQRDLAAPLAPVGACEGAARAEGGAGSSLTPVA